MTITMCKYYTIILNAPAVNSTTLESILHFESCVIHGLLVILSCVCYIGCGVTEPVAPVAYQVVLEPGIGQFREFESLRVHTRISSWGLFLCTNGLAESTRA